MNAFRLAYHPDSSVPVILLGIVAWISLVTGAFLPRCSFDQQGRGRMLVAWAWAWAWVSFSLVATQVILMQAESPAGFRMLAIVSVLLLGMKALVHMEWVKRKGVQPLSLFRYGLFALLWLGMRPEVFATRTINRRVDSGLLRQGVCCVVVGLIFLVFARLLNGGLVTDLLLLAGLSLFLHFGLLSLSAWLFQCAGFRTSLLFRNPLKAASLGDFWARFWNLGYVEMTSRLVHRPIRRLCQRWGLSPGLIPVLAAFGFSGLLHEAAITVPAMTAFGGPLSYFMLHGFLVVFETTFAPARPFLLAHALVARIWIITALVVPLPLLFVRPFMDEVLLPLIGLGAN